MNKVAWKQGQKAERATVGSRVGKAFDMFVGALEMLAQPRKTAAAGVRRIGRGVVDIGNSLDFVPTGQTAPLPADAKGLTTNAILTNQIAPPPNTDRYPIIIGSLLTFQYISSAERAALTGYRMQQVDVYSELLDHEGHGFGVVAQRILNVVDGKMSYEPADSSDRAKQLCDEIEGDLEQLDDIDTVKSNLMWHGLYFGLGCNEKIFERADRYRIVDFEMVHSRRLSYPDWLYWDLHIWDQGLGGGMGSDAAKFGIRIADFPNKFVIHKPQIRGEYPTREGLGRLLSTIFALKRMVLRVTAQDFERFIKPWVLAYYNTGFGGDEARIASDEDIAASETATRALGQGALTSASLPNSIKIELLRAASSMTQMDFANFLDQTMDILVRGQTFTTAPGKFGTKGGNETGNEGEMKIARQDAKQLAATWRRDVVRSLMFLNHPSELHLTPKVKIVPQTTPDLTKLSAMITEQVANGMPVSRNVAASELGLTLAEGTDPKDVPLTPMTAVDPSRIAGNEHVKEPPKPEVTLPPKGGPKKE